MFHLFVFLTGFTAVCRSQGFDRGRPELVLRTSTPVFTSEILQFHCRVDAGRSNWTINWYRNGAKIAGSDPMLGDSNMTVQAASQEDSGRYSCAVGDGSPSMPIKQSQDLQVQVHKKPTPNLQVLSWVEVFQKEVVVLLCQADVQNWTFIWFRNDIPIQEDSVVWMEDEGSLLNITSVTKSHQGIYTCKAKHPSRNVLSDMSNSTTVYVHEKPTSNLQVLSWVEVFQKEVVVLLCQADVQDWTFIWFRNDIPIQEDSVVWMEDEGSLLNITSVTKSHQGNYTCKAKHPSRNVLSDMSNSTTVYVHEQTPTASLRKDPVLTQMYVGESVTFTCSVDTGSDWDYLWFKDEVSLPAKRGPLLTFVLDRDHQGQYQCQATRGQYQITQTRLSGKLKIEVLEKPTPNLQVLSWVKVFQKEVVVLLCQADVQDWIFIWFRNDIPIQKDSVVRMEDKGSLLNITSVTKSHQGIYTCKAKHPSRNVLSDMSNSTTVYVHEQTPTASLRQDPVLTQMYVEESVTFTCSVDTGSGWDYLWFKDEVSLPDKRGPQLTFVLDRDHQGQYQCQATRGQNQIMQTRLSGKLKIEVLEKPTPNLQVLSWVEVFQKEVVVLLCQADVQDWTFIWFRNEIPVQKDSVVWMKDDGSLLNITSVTKSHQGIYTCKAKHPSRNVLSDMSNSTTVYVHEQTPTASLRKDPVLTQMYVGENVTFTCSVDTGSDWDYLWFKDEVPHSAKRGPQLTFVLHRDHQGQYQCQATRGLNQITLTRLSRKLKTEVLDVPKPTMDLMTAWPDVFPTERVQLRCNIKDSTGWIFSWEKDSSPVTAGGMRHINLNAGGSILSISSASDNHKGSYSCRGKLHGRSVNTTPSTGIGLTVYKTQPTVSLTRQPDYQRMFLEDPMTLSCHVTDSKGWMYIWFRDNKKLNERTSSLIIPHLKKTDAGSYTCMAQRGSDTVLKTVEHPGVQLTVEARPLAVVILSTSWSEVFSTDNLVLLCKIEESTDHWNYTWYKEKVEINQTFNSSKHIVTPQNNPDQGEYTCRGRKTSRPDFSLMSVPFKTKNLLLKRRVLLSISGCLFFSLIAIVLGFIIYKVFRKPVREEAKKEEEDLFLTMDQLKDGVAPCQLKDYVSSIDIPVKAAEVDQNGTGSPDTDPLTMTSEDQPGETPTSLFCPEEPEDGLLSFRQ